MAAPSRRASERQREGNPYREPPKGAAVSGLGCKPQVLCRVQCRFSPTSPHTHPAIARAAAACPRSFQCPSPSSAFGKPWR